MNGPAATPGTSGPSSLDPCPLVPAPKPRKQRAQVGAEEALSHVPGLQGAGWRLGLRERAQGFGCQLLTSPRPPILVPDGRIGGMRKAETRGAPAPAPAPAGLPHPRARVLVPPLRFASAGLPVPSSSGRQPPRPAPTHTLLHLSPLEPPRQRLVWGAPWRQLLPSQASCELNRRARGKGTRSGPWPCRSHWRGICLTWMTWTSPARPDFLPGLRAGIPSQSLPPSWPAEERENWKSHWEYFPQALVTLQIQPVESLVSGGQCQVDVPQPGASCV
jgi:hypothetical protein